MVDFLHNSCRFFAHESCGQCTPCREGTHWSLMMLERIKAGRGRLIDLDLPGWRSATRSASSPARRSAAWPTAPPGRSRTRSSKFRARVRRIHQADEPERICRALRPCRRCVAEHQRKAALRPCPRSPSTETKSNSPTASASTASKRPSGPASRSRTIAGIRACTVVGSCRMCLVETGNRDPKTGRRSRCCPSWCPAAPCPANDGTGLCHQQRQGEAGAGDGRGRPAAAAPDRLPDLRQGGRVLPCRTITSSMGRPSGGPTCALHQPPPRHGRYVTLFVDRCVMCTRCVRFCARDQRHERADGHQPRRARGNRRLARLSAGTTSFPATSSISAPSARWATRISSTSSGSGS